MSAGPESSDAAPAPRGWKRWRGPLLFASLVLNLFLIGVIAGSLAHHRHGPGWFGAMQRERGEPRIGGPSQFRQAVQSLPEPDRRVFEETIAPFRSEVVKDQQEFRRLRQRATEAVRAEPFDKQAFLAVMGELRQRQTAIQTRMHGGTAEALAKVTPEARRQFADHFGPRPRPPR